MILLTVVSLSPVDRYKAGFASYDPQVGLFANRRHRIVHWLSFGGLAFVLGLLGRNTRQRVLGSAAVAGLGLGIEYLQHVIYMNPLETWDIRDDLRASLVGLIGALCVGAVRKSTKAKVLSQ
jgi:hypothetical protein